LASFRATHVSMKPSLGDLVEGAFGREVLASVPVRVPFYEVLWVYVPAFWKPYAIQIWPLDEVLAHRWAARVQELELPSEGAHATLGGYLNKLSVQNWNTYLLWSPAFRIAPRQ
ncbi:4376_t:CDS:1, partial [Acaulospora colombiana]